MGEMTAARRPSPGAPRPTKAIGLKRGVFLAAAVMLESGSEEMPGPEMVHTDPGRGSHTDRALTAAGDDQRKTAPEQAQRDDLILASDASLLTSTGIDPCNRAFVMASEFRLARVEGCVDRIEFNERVELRAGSVDQSPLVHQALAEPAI